MHNFSAIPCAEKTQDEPLKNQEKYVIVNLKSSINFISILFFAIYFGYFLFKTDNLWCMIYPGGSNG